MAKQLLIEKKKKKEKMIDTIENGKAQLINTDVEIPKIPLELAEGIKKAIRESGEDPTKFTITRDMNTYDMLNWFTRYKNFDDVLRMNTIEVMIQLYGVVYGDNPAVKKITDVFKMHVIQHKVNMTSLQSKRETAIVNMLRGDNSIINSSEARKWLMSK